MKRQHFKLYLFSVVPFLALILILLTLGKTLQPSAYVAEIRNAHAGGGSIAESFKHPLTILLMQMLVVLGTAKLIGYLFTRMGQQSVMGEIVAGIVLGPSLFGWLMPEGFLFLFPTDSLPNLHLLSQIGLVLFMFIIGMELDTGILKTRATEALIVSHVSIVFPYFLGVTLAYFLYAEFAPANIPFIAYALFMGIAMSITAFPVLARILKERKMTKTPVGSMAIICAAIGDATGWCILAVVIAIAKAGDASGAIFTLILTVAYVLFMFSVVRPLLKRGSEKYFAHGKIQSTYIAIVFLTLLLSSFLAETIGIHALFGAFIAGAVMPANVSLRNLFAERMEDVSVMLLLPLFFAFTGLKTQIGLLNTPWLWSVCGLIILLAIVGKFVGSALSAKLVGQSWKDSLSIGALMNTRGLMELIILNIGYDLGILKPEIFTMMVFMALATTFMTSPALNLIEWYYAKKK